MPRTVPLRRFPPPLRLEVRPLGRLEADGRLTWEAPLLPAPGPARLVVWRPGEDPAFEALEGVLRPGGRFSGPGRGGWVVLLVAP